MKISLSDSDLVCYNARLAAIKPNVASVVRKAG